VDGYRASHDQEAIRLRLRRFYEDEWWNVTKSRAELLEELRGLVSDVEKYDLATVTGLSNAANRLGDAPLAQQILSRTIERLRTWAASHDMGEDPGPSPILREIHPQIRAAQDELRVKQYPRLGIGEAVKRMHVNHGWGERETYSLKTATMEEYVESLNALSPEDLALFVREHLRWAAPGHSSAPEFINATAKFLDASRRIVSQSSDSRLAGMLAREFKKAGLAERLTTSGPN
jgi:hypothetical protein